MERINLTFTHIYLLYTFTNNNNILFITLIFALSTGDRSCSYNLLLTLAEDQTLEIIGSSVKPQKRKGSYGINLGSEQSSAKQNYAFCFFFWKKKNFA
jgi:hypothetical protein